MKQGKLEVVKKGMARVNFNTLGISEIKWIQMGEFNSDAIISTTMGKNALEKNAEEKTSHSQPKSLKQYLGAISKMAQ